MLIVRAGDRSLHKHWLNGDRVRNFDLHVSYFGGRDISEVVRGLDITATAEKGAKFPGLVQCLSKLGSKTSQYDYIGFPDDDLYATCQTWNWFFEIVTELRPAVAQPSLHRSSFYTYAGLLQVPRLLVRWTNLIEVMTPVFSSASLAKAVPLFKRKQLRLGDGLSLAGTLPSSGPYTLRGGPDSSIAHTSCSVWAALQRTWQNW